MKVVSAGSAFPPHRYNQPSIVAALQAFWGDRLHNPQLLERLHRHAGVEGRNLVLPVEAYAGLDTWGKANSVWITEAERLGATAICRALGPAGLAPEDIHALYFVTVTGIASPSIDARLVTRMGLSRNLKRVPIFGLGCVAGAAGIARAADYVRAFPGQIAVLLSVELCSLTWQREDLSMANLIASGLFADGAAAVVVAGSQTGLTGPEVVATRSVFYPNTHDVMGWDISERGFRIVLSPDVPFVIKSHLRDDVEAFLGDCGLTRRDISSWIMHPGGPRVLEAVQDALELTGDELAPSWECLRRVGNLSSASVLLVLEDYLANRRGRPGSYSLLGAMGPGFCSELVLLRWS
jgi:alkylresorcinol/alkylpyrone synthase